VPACPAGRAALPAPAALAPPKKKADDVWAALDAEQAAMRDDLADLSRSTTSRRRAVAAGAVQWWRRRRRRR
jgi:hypothetical protein